MVDILTTEQLDQLSTKTAQKAVAETFRIFGVDVNNAEQVENFRRDLRFAGDIRRATAKGVIAIVVTLCTGTVGLIFLGVQSKIGG